jgi:hypothetical protein
MLLYIFLNMSSNILFKTESVHDFHLPIYRVQLKGGARLPHDQNKK